jgi:hypothetical protein
MFPTRTTDADDAKVFRRLETAPVHEGWGALVLRQPWANARIEPFWTVRIDVDERRLPRRKATIQSGAKRLFCPLTQLPVIERRSPFVSKR